MYFKIVNITYCMFWYLNKDWVINMYYYYYYHYYYYYFHIQLNLSITATLVTEGTVCYIEVAVGERFKHFSQYMNYLTAGTKKVTVVEMWPLLISSSANKTLELIRRIAFPLNCFPISFTLSLTALTLWLAPLKMYFNLYRIYWRRIRLWKWKHFKASYWRTVMIWLVYSSTQ